MSDHSELIARLDKVGKFDALCAEAAAALREQAGEIERLTIDRDDFGKASANNWESFKRVRAERDTLASENAGLRKDAERYRWLRKGAPKPIHGASGTVRDGTEPHVIAILPGVEPYITRLSHGNLDVYVDASMEAK